MGILDNYGRQVEELLDAAAQLVSSGIMKRSDHGNISIKVPDADAFLLNPGHALANLKPENLALFASDGSLIEGVIPPNSANIIRMHGTIYRTRPAFTSVVHTHVPFATSFAVAGQPIPVAYEMLIPRGMADGVPVARYALHGSDQAYQNIASVLLNFEKIRALLLENHGLLTFADSVAEAIRATKVVEECAEIVQLAQSLGGAKPIPDDLVKAT